MVLAVSFGFYSLIRKRTTVGAVPGLFVETLLLGPIAVGYLAWSHARPEAAAFNTPGTLGLLTLAGVVTVAPLVWFVAAAKRLTLVTIGFLQPLAPTIQFIIAVFIFNESFDFDRFVAFGMIWIAVAVFIGDVFIRNNRRRGAVVPPME
jgi:chloramphenicol-sensitive protein RarD